MNHLERGHSWSLRGDEAIDRITIETVSDTGSGHRMALLAESMRDGEVMRFHPGGDVEARLTMPLTAVRYAIAAEEETEHHALLARYAAPMLLDAGPLIAHLDDPGEGGFEIFADSGGGGGATSATIAPRLCGVTTPDAAHAIVNTFNVDAKATLPFRWNSLPCELARFGRYLDVRFRGSRVAWSDPKTSVLRPQDLLKLDFEFRNFDLVVRHRRARLVVREPSQPAYLIVTFPPQHIAETAIDEVDPQPVLNLPVTSRTAGNSRLAFCVTDVPRKGLEWSIETLLDWSRYAMHIVPVAAGGESTTCATAGGTGARNPGPDETAIEAPYRLILSPNSRAAWAHSKSPVESRKHCPPPVWPPTPSDASSTPSNPPTCEVCLETVAPTRRKPTIWDRVRRKFHHEQLPRGFPRTELWHTRLGVRRSDGVLDENDAAHRTLRAVWSPDFDLQPSCLPPSNDADHAPFGPPSGLPKASLRKSDRCRIVRLTTESSAGRAPLFAERFMLTSLGATFRLRGIWDQNDIPLNKYIHRAFLGRDEYVEVTLAGVLYPLGHPALFITIAERKFDTANVEGGTAPAAYLHRRQFIQVVRKTQKYPLIADSGEKPGRRMPFREIDIDLEFSPNLVEPRSNGATESPLGDEAFWPRLRNTNTLFEWPITVRDNVNPPISTKIPLMFVARTVTTDSTRIESVRQHYIDDSREPRRRAPFFDQRIAYAPAKTARADGVPQSSDVDPSLETETLTFTIDDVAGTPPWQDTDVTFARLFYPATQKARVSIPAVQQITPTSTKPEVAYHDAFTRDGFDITSGRNPGEVFLRITRDAPALNFTSADNTTPKGGAIAAPNSSVAGLSRALGAVQAIGANADAALTRAKEGGFDPGLVFDLNAKILGGIELADILGQVLGNQQIRDLAKIPKLISEAIRDVVRQAEEARTRGRELIAELRATAEGEVHRRLEALRQELQTQVQAASEEADRRIQEVLTPARERIDEIRDKALTQLATSASATAAQALAIRQAFDADLQQHRQDAIAGVAQLREAASILPGGQTFNALSRLDQALQQEDPVQLVSEVLRAVAEVKNAVVEDLQSLTDVAAFRQRLQRLLIDVAQAAFDQARDRLAADLANARATALARLAEAAALTNEIRAELDRIQTEINALRTAFDAERDRVLGVARNVESAARAFVDSQITAVRQSIQRVRDEAENRIRAALGLPSEIRIRYELNPEVRSIFIFVAELDGRKATLNITAEFRKSLLQVTDQPTYSIEGTLRNFQVRLLESPEFVRVQFRELRFVSRNGAKPDVSVDIAGMELGGGLSFLKTLQSFLEKINPANGPFLQLDGLGILAGYRFTLPPTTLGAFSLTNISLSAAVSLPFTGAPARVRFAFAERRKPFLLTVSIFGGGGFFAMALGVDTLGVELLEGALEFGAAAALDLGVARGEAHILGGIYFKRESNASVLSGYVRAGGSFDVLGLITASIELYMGLTQNIVGNKSTVYGEARLTIEIEILFFSTSVDIYSRYEFEGSEQSRTEALALSAEESEEPFLTDDSWVAYQDAFA